MADLRDPVPAGRGAVAPSGEQYELRRGDQRAVAVQVGGGLRRYSVDGADLLDGYPRTERADGGRGQVLAPWPNRVAGGAWTWRGEPQQLALTEPGRGNAIHGLLRWVPWRRVGGGPADVVLEGVVHPQPGWPGTLQVLVRYVLTHDGLQVGAELRNLGPAPLPAAVGFHPYLTAGTPRVDDAVLRLGATSWLPVDDRQIPTGVEPVDGSELDFRTARPVGTTRLDHALTGLVRAADGLCRVRLSGAHDVELVLGEGFTHVQAYTGDALPDPRRRRQGIALEPMTAPPNALATGEGLAVLEPAAVLEVGWGLRRA